ncbi:MAG: peptidoglycan-binding protein [Burkholderiaceae bacterium]
MFATSSEPVIGPMRLGMRNESVRHVQNRLNFLSVFAGASSPLTSDGDFGHRTDAAVRAFQKSKGLKADGVVGPVTAKAMGFTNYTTLRRMRQGAMELASVITGSLARLIPAPQDEPDPNYSALVALSVHADVLHRVLKVLGTIPGATEVMAELDKVIRDLQMQLHMAKGSMANGIFAHLKAQQDSLHGRLLALSRKLHALAMPSQATLGEGGKSGLRLVGMQMQMLNMHGHMLSNFGAARSHADPADELLKIAANILRTANSLLPRF